MATVTNTNHNIFTLTVHVVKSVNKAAGKVDKKVYGDSVTVVPTKPPPKKPSFMEGVTFFFALVFGFVILCVWIGRYQRFSDKVKSKLFD